MDQTIQLSSDGDWTPRWSTDGRSVFYVVGAALVAVDAPACGSRECALDRKRTSSLPAGLKIDPNFDPLRKNPSFQKLVAGG
jgi:hypothetical protein